MTTTTAANIPDEVAALLDRQGIQIATERVTFTGGFGMYEVKSLDIHLNEGWSATHPDRVTVRITVDDETIQIYRMTGRGQLIGARATFNDTPASVITAVV